MSDVNDTGRILARNMARDLDDSEIDNVAGAGGNPYPTPIEWDTNNGLDMEWIIITDNDT